MEDKKLNEMLVEVKNSMVENKISELDVYKTNLTPIDIKNKNIDSKLKVKVEYLVNYLFLDRDIDLSLSFKLLDGNALKVIQKGSYQDLVTFSDGNDYQSELIV